MKYEKYLPIGSVVFLKLKDKKIMITGFNAAANTEEKVYDYCGCLYPEGFFSIDKMILFNHNDIQRVYCLGYSDDEEKGFKVLLKEMEEIL